jgi:hypothetical protein
MYIVSNNFKYSMSTNKAKCCHSWQELHNSLPAITTTAAEIIHATVQNCAYHYVKL